MIFDLSDQFSLDWDSVRQICTDLNVNVKMINRNRIGSGGPGSSLPPPIPGRSRTIQLVAAERSAGNIFEARRRILGGVEPPTIPNVPPTYMLRHIAPPGIHCAYSYLYMWWLLNTINVSLYSFDYVF